MLSLGQGQIHQLAGSVLRVVFFLRQVGDGDGGPLTGERDRHRPADSGVAARDQGGLAAQGTAAAVAFLAVVRLGLHGRGEAGLFLDLFRERAGMVAETGMTYRLRLDAIHGLAAKVLARPQVLVPEGVAADEFDRKVLKDFVTPEGRLRELPEPERKFEVALRYVLTAFETGREYSEKEVNAVLAGFNPDFATLRRGMIDRRWLERERDGRVYWKVMAEGGG